MAKKWAAANVSCPCEPVCTGCLVLEPVWAGTNCFVHLALAAARKEWCSFSSNALRGFGCGVLSSFGLLPGERCACCGFLAIVSYKYFKNVVRKQCPFYSYSSSFVCDKNLLICFSFGLLFVCHLSYLEKLIKWC